MYKREVRITLRGTEVTALDALVRGLNDEVCTRRVSHVHNEWVYLETRKIGAQLYALNYHASNVGGSLASTLTVMRRGGRWYPLSVSFPYRLYNGVEVLDDGIIVSRDPETLIVVHALAREILKHVHVVDGAATLDSGAE